MENKANFDAERYCRHNAGRMGEWFGRDIAELIRDEITALREENTQLRRDIAALKDAARPVVKVYIDAKNNQIWSGATVTGETMALPGVTVAQLDNFARLCGEK